MSYKIKCQSCGFEGQVIDDTCESHCCSCYNKQREEIELLRVERTRCKGPYVLIKLDGKCIIVGKRVKEEIESLQSQLLCDACAGTGKPVSGLPCICGGSGSGADEKAGLRKELFKVQSQLTTSREQLAKAEKFKQLNKAASSIIDGHTTQLKIKNRKIKEATQDRDSLQQENERLRGAVRKALPCLQGRVSSFDPGAKARHILEKAFTQNTKEDM